MILVLYYFQRIYRFRGLCPLNSQLGGCTFFSYTTCWPLPIYIMPQSIHLQTISLTDLGYVFTCTGLSSMPIFILINIFSKTKANNSLVAVFFHPVVCFASVFEHMFILMRNLLLCLVSNFLCFTFNICVNLFCKKFKFINTLTL